MKVTIIPIVIGALGKVTKVSVQGVEDMEITGQLETIQTTEFAEIGQNTEKTGDLRRLIVTQTVVKDHQLTLM